MRVTCVSAIHSSRTNAICGIHLGVDISIWEDSMFSNSIFLYMLFRLCFNKIWKLYIKHLIWTYSLSCHIILSISLSLRLLSVSLLLLFISIFYWWALYFLFLLHITYNCPHKRHTSNKHILHANMEQTDLTSSFNP